MLYNTKVRAKDSINNTPKHYRRVEVTMKTGWQNIGYPLPPKEQRMKMTSENYYKIIAMRDELIFEQKDEIAKLKMKINQLQLKLERL